MTKGTGRTVRPKRTGPDKSGHGGAPGPAPFGASWRYERDLCARKDGSLDEAELKRWYRARRERDVWVRKGPNGSLQLACDPAEPDRPLRRSELDQVDQAGAPSLMQRHRELEARLRQCPYLGDGSDALPVVRFPLSRSEFRELIDLRKLHGCGEDWGSGEMRVFWRPDCDDNIVGRGRRLLPRYVLKGRALS